MTTVEAKDLLKARVEWKKPLDTGFSFLTFTPPESGRYLQEEHATVRIPIIYDLIVDEGISNTDFQAFLKEFKETAILQMLHDVFSEVKEIDALKITNNINLFDYAIILKLTINNISSVLNSTRINMQTIVSKENLNKYYIDLNGIKDRENGVFVSGFTERYRREIERIRKVLFVRKGRLKVVTAR